MTAEEAFYYGPEGEVVPLRPSPQSAIDLARVDVALAEEVAAIVAEDQPVRGSVYLVDDADLDPDLQRALDEAGALHPAFTTDDGTTIVVLPEVRVASAEASAGAEVRAAIEAGELDAELAEDRGFRLELRPSSGRGRDALALANRLHEDHRAEMVQARFLRVTARPTDRPS